MQAIPSPVLVNLLIFLTFPLAGGYLAAKLKLPALIGYILGGIAIGLILNDETSRSILTQIANFGIILLLFTVGLEVNLANLKRFGPFALIGGIAQMTISALAIFFLALLFHFSLLEAIFIGTSFALSSTAVIAKLIQAKGEENSLLGGLIIGILILQDLAVIPLIIIFSAPANQTGAIELAVNLLLAVFKSGVILLLILFIGKIIIPLIFNGLADLSRELLNLFTIFLIALSVYVFSFLGLPASIAAFMAGILVGQTLEHYHVFSQIRPLRDLFAIFFFVFLGANVPISTIAARWPTIVTFAALIILLKFVLAAAIFLIYRFHSRTAFSIGLYLAQVGEFSFIIMYQGFTRGMISQETYVTAIASVLVTISITPVIIAQKERIYAIIKILLQCLLPPLSNYIQQTVDREPAGSEEINLTNHVIICGFGRVGSYIGKALQIAAIPFIAIDRNFYVVANNRRRGVNILYGDPTDIDILDYAEAGHAKVLISAVPNLRSQKLIIVNAKKLNPAIKIFSRIHDEKSQKLVQNLGAEMAIQPEFEASLTIIKKILAIMGISHKTIAQEFRQLKQEHDTSVRPNLANH